MEKPNHSYVTQEMQNGIATLENDPVVAHMSIYPREIQAYFFMFTHTQTHTTCTQTFIAALFIIVENENNPGGFHQ